MSIASAITAAQGRVADCYTAISNKGGTLPATQNLSNMPTAISSIPSGGGTIDSITITPTTSQQIITASGGVNGYSPITVNAVTSSIDANITTGNIKSGVSILGVSGSLTELKGETRSVSLTNKNGQTFTPSSGKNGITSITVTPNNQAKTITPTTSQQSISVPSGYSGFGALTVNAVTASIDANITAGNIKKDVQILGVTGTYEGGGGGGGTKYGASIDSVLGDTNANGVLQYPTGGGALVFDNVEDVADMALYYKFYNNNAITSVSFPDLTTISNSNAISHGFDNNTEITLVSFPKLETVSGNGCMAYCFYKNTKITSIDLSKLKTVSGNQALNYIFDSCQIVGQNLDLSSLQTVSGNNSFTRAFYNNKFTNIDLSSLQTVSGSSAFSSCFGTNSLETINLSSLKEITGTSAFNGCFGSSLEFRQISFNSLDTVNAATIFSSCFGTCRKLLSISFPALNTNSFGTFVNQFSGMFNSNTASTSGSCTVHFPSNLQTKVSRLTGYPTFGGNSSRIVIAFDLPATS